MELGLFYEVIQLAYCCQRTHRKRVAENNHGHFRSISHSFYKRILYFVAVIGNPRKTLSYVYALRLWKIIFL